MHRASPYSSVSTARRAAPVCSRDLVARPLACAVFGLLTACLAACGQSNSGGTNTPVNPVVGTPDSGFNLLPDGRPADVFAMAGGCFGIRHQASDQFLVADDNGDLSFSAQRPEDATGFTMQATGLGRYAFYAPDRSYLSIAGDNEAEIEEAARRARQSGNNASSGGDVLVIVEPAEPIGGGINDAGGAAGDAAGDGASLTAINRRLRLTDEAFRGSEWTVSDNTTDRFAISNTFIEQTLEDAAGVTGNEFDFIPAGESCTPYPEAQLNATGTPFSGTNPDGTVFGYAETHMHLGGSEALGGQIGYGRPFHTFGITHALDDCQDMHGGGGAGDGFDPLVNPNKTTPDHSTVGWPTYEDWPSHGSQTHHQTYWMWLKRAHAGGLRFMVNHLVANEILCQAWPKKENDCDEMESARLQLQLVHELQDYIDAQSGGPGKGFFRIVTSSAEARRVIEAGKMAVINGTEMEKVFACGEYLDSPECTLEEIDERVAEWYDMGLRAVFPIHIFDNAFGGSEIARFTSDAALIQAYNAGNIVETGHPYAAIPCSEAEAVEQGEAETEDRDIFGLIATQAQNPPPFPNSGCVNNARGLTSTGDYFIHKLIDTGIIIETDHTGPLARKRMLDIALERGVPVVSGHSGSVTFSRDSARILATGGVISNLSDDPAPVTIAFINDLRVAYMDTFGTLEGFATGFGSDINGIHRQSGPRDDVAENPLEYPFSSYAGDMVFDKQTTGERVYDLNIDGVAHYGLYPDYIADIEMTPGGPAALDALFKSAEAYLQVWETVEAAAARAQQ